MYSATYDVGRYICETNRTKSDTCANASGSPGTRQHRSSSILLLCTKQMYQWARFNAAMRTQHMGILVDSVLVNCTPSAPPNEYIHDAHRSLGQYGDFTPEPIIVDPVCLVSLRATKVFRTDRIGRRLARVGRYSRAASTISSATKTACCNTS